jgi:hypothetical protein
VDRRSSKVAVSLATGGLVPHLLEPLTAGLTGAAAAQGSQAAAAAAAGGGSPASAPILRAKLLEVVRIMYQHYPRPKEFIMKYRIQVGWEWVGQAAASCYIGMYLGYFMRR